MTGTVFDVQRFSVHDGPGIRTTVFMKGCSLHCAWCHNPEGLLPQAQLQYTKQECIHCGQCAVPPVWEDAKNCPSGALKICGEQWEEEALFQAVLRDKCFYGENGGVTFSGGECLLQADFVSQMLRRLKHAEVHTAVDTAGHVSWDAFEKTLAYCDLYLYDIKTMDPKLHQQYTGADNTLILKNLKKLCSLGKRIWIRIPVIPNVNDNEKEMRTIYDFIAPFSSIEKVTLMPYHTLGKSKYETLGLVCSYHAKKTIEPCTIRDFSKIFGELASE